MTTEDLMKLLGDFPEINPSNYGDDDVNALNAWGIAAHTALEALGREVAELRQDRDEWKDSTIAANYRFTTAENKLYGVEVERDQARAELAAIRAQEPIGKLFVSEHGDSGIGIEFTIDKPEEKLCVNQAVYASPAAKDAGLVADGWKLMPPEATSNMYSAAAEALTEHAKMLKAMGRSTDMIHTSDEALSRKMYAAMLAAAPKIGGV